MPDLMERLRSSTELRWRALLFAGFAVAGLLVRSTNSTAASGCQGTIGEWHQIYWYSVVLILTAQMSNTVREFFVGEGPGLGDHIQYFLLNKPYAETKEEVLARDQVGFWTLMPSAFITWIFAKSINNAAVWGGMFGVVGGLAYAGWYTSFFSASLVGYYLRTRHGFRCLPIAVERCYGPAGLICLNIALLFRLWNEIWSNVAVVASFYSAETRTTEWWLAAVLSAAVRPGARAHMQGVENGRAGVRRLHGRVAHHLALPLLGPAIRPSRSDKAVRRSLRLFRTDPDRSECHHPATASDGVSYSTLWGARAGADAPGQEPSGHGRSGDSRNRSKVGVLVAQSVGT